MCAVMHESNNYSNELKKPACCRFTVVGHRSDTQAETIKPDVLKTNSTQWSITCALHTRWARNVR